MRRIRFTVVPQLGPVVSADMYVEVPGGLSTYRR